MKGAAPFIALCAFALACLTFIAHGALQREPAPLRWVPVELPAGRVLMTGCAGAAPSVLIELPGGRQECHTLRSVPA